MQSNPHYEPRGQEFESLRARQCDTNLGTPAGAPIFISDTVFSAAVLPRRAAFYNLLKQIFTLHCCRGSSTQQTASKYGLHFTAAISNQVDDDPAACDTIDHPIRLEKGLAIFFDPKAE